MRSVQVVVGNPSAATPHTFAVKPVLVAEGTARSTPVRVYPDVSEPVVNLCAYTS